MSFQSGYPAPQSHLILLLIVDDGSLLVCFILLGVRFNQTFFRSIGYSDLSLHFARFCRFSAYQLKSQSATSLKHARSTEDFSKSPQSTPRPTRRCSLQYQSVLFPDKRFPNGSSSSNLDRKHHGSTTTLGSKDKGFHGSFHSISLKKDKSLHGSHTSVKHVDRSYSEPRSSSHADKKPHLWHPRKVSSVAKPKFGHKRHGSHAEKIAKLKRAKEDEALEKLRKKSSINATWLTSSRVSIGLLLISALSKFTLASI